MTERVRRKVLLWVLLLPVLAVTAWLLVVVVERIAYHKDTVPAVLPGDGSPDSPAPPQPPPADPSMPGEDSGRPRLVLVGTVVASDPAWSRASLTIGPDRSSTRVYRIGDLLPDRSTLVAIRANRVVLRRDGKRRVLRIQKPKPAPPPAEPSEPQEPADQPGRLVKPAGPGRYQVDRQGLLELLERSDELIRDTRVSLAFAPDGGVQGLHLNIIGSGTVFGQFDLQDGDLIHRIGSVIIDHPDKIEQLPDLLRNVREVDVELTRDGEMKSLRYFID